MHAAAGNPVRQTEYGDPAFAPMRERDLERVFTQFLDPVYRFFYARVGNREDTEDLTSRVFVKATKQLDTVRSEVSVASWLFTVARTVLADHWRQYYRAPAQLELDDQTVAEKVAARPTEDPSLATYRLVEEILQALSPRYRRVLELRFLQGYSVVEAAEELNVTPGNLKVLQHRALGRATELGLPALEEHGEQRSPQFDAAGSATLHKQEHETLATSHM
jgi:RNA polymerase sigma factor (sigma-70 family)